MNVRLLDLARQELDDAFVWYETQSEELGRDFLDALDRAVRRVVAFPLSCAEIEPGLRRCLLVRFPYGLIYGLDGEDVVVVAVSHLHRKPREWVERIR